MNDFWKHLIREEKLSLLTVEYIQAKYGEDLSEEMIDRIMKLIATIKEMGIDIRVVNQNRQIFDILDITDDDFESALNYVYSFQKKKQKNVSKLIISLFISANNIIKNNRKEEVKKILELFRQEGLQIIFEIKVEESTKILKEGTYKQIFDNLLILRQEKTYKELIKEKPSILLLNSNKLKEIVESIKKQKQIDSHDEETSNKEENNEDVDDNENAETESIDNEESSNMVLLGEENEVLPVLQILKDYEVPYYVLIYCPQIIERKKISEIKDILDIMYKNDVSFNLLIFFPQILAIAKSKNVKEIIDELKNQNLSLYILQICPEILINSSKSKIRKLIGEIESNDISKYIVNSFPQLLLTGNLKMMKKICDEVNINYPDINLIFDKICDEKNESPYVFINEIFEYSNSITQNDDSETIDLDAINDEKVFRIKNMNETQKTLEILKQNRISLDIIKEDKKILNVSSKKATSIISKLNEGLVEVKEKKAEDESVVFKSKTDIGKKIIEKCPQILHKSSKEEVKETIDALKHSRPNLFDSIIEECPQIFFESDSKKISKTVEVIKKNKIDLSVLDKSPRIFIRQNDDLDKIITALVNNGISKKKIEEAPETLAQGEIKYIDRNFETFKRNKLNIPFGLAHVKSARNNEKNIDTLISVSLEEYIERSPEVLLIKNTSLNQYIEIAKEYNIPLVVKNKNKDKVLNMEYLNMEEKKVQKTYGISKKEFLKQKEKFEKADEQLRRVKNETLYNNVYSIISKQATETLKEYEISDIAYRKNNRSVSKQKVIRETYLDLEEKVASGGKQELKKINIEVLLMEKIDSLTKTEKEKSKTKKRESVERIRF